jgi:hypothetical protein
MNGATNLTHTFAFVSLSIVLLFPPELSRRASASSPVETSAPTDSAVVASDGTVAEPTAAVPGSVSQLPPSSERWALVIGVSRYDDPNLNPLYGQNDAKKIAKDLEQYAGFPPLQIILLTDDQPRDHQPTRERIWFWLSVIKQNASPAGLIMIMFSGHGLQSGGSTFLMPRDAYLNFDETYLTQNAISADVLNDSLRSSLAKQVILLVDACRNNPYATEGPDANQMSSRFADSFNYEKLNLGKEAYATIFSTSVGSESYQYQSEKMGYFSWVLDQALSGAAYDSNGQLTLQGLLAYLQQNTPKLVKLYNPGKEQVPYALIGGYLADQVVLVGTSYTSGKPAERSPHRADSSSIPFKSIFRFRALPVNLSVTPDGSRFNYGYSSVESDPAIAGQDIQISNVQVDLQVKPHTEYGCCDVWVLLGPETIKGIHEPGQATGQYFFVNANTSQAPVQAQFVIGGKQLSKENVATYTASYDFDSGRPKGDIKASKGKAFFAPLLDLPNGLFAQVLMWSGDPSDNLEVIALSVTVQGRVKRKSAQ